MNSNYWLLLKVVVNTCDKVSNTGADGEEFVEVGSGQHQAADGQRGEPDQPLFNVYHRYWVT